MKSLIRASTLATLSLLPSLARADDDEPIGGSVAISNWSNDPVYVPSAESFTLEFRFGGYRPDMGPSFGATFGGDIGPLLAMELAYHAFRIPYVGPITLGARVGWVEWTGQASSSSGASVGSTGMSVLLMTPVVGLRIDGLARELGVPLVLTGKFGLDIGYYETGTTGVRDASGVSLGLMAGGQLALELDFLAPRSARQLDEEWGVNHVSIFGELLTSTMGSFSERHLPLGTSLAWSAGLAFSF